MRRREADFDRDSPSSYLDTSLPEAVVNYDTEGKPLRGDRQTSVAEAIQVTESVDEAFASNLRLLVKPKSSVVPKVIGVQYPELSETSQKSDGTLSESNALTVTLDTTTYTDRAVVTIENNRGFDVYLTALSIHGRRVIRYPDALINDSLKRDDDIRRNGEKVLHVANNYIVNGTQVDKIADFWFKYYQSRKHIYSIAIKGTAPWYEVGEWYQLTLGSADSVEYLDATVECYSVQCERTAGGIGTTVCMFREVLEGWAKTTLYTARAILGGSPSRRTARSNSVTVASSTFDGVYDYRCDGTADDVQIQAAIDYVAKAYGGGTVLLTHGVYNISSGIVMRTGVTLSGAGLATVLTLVSNSVRIFIDMSASENSGITDMSINGNKGNYAYDAGALADAAIVIYGTSGELSYQVTNVSIYDFKRVSTLAEAVVLVGIVSCSNLKKVSISGFEATNLNASYGAQASAFLDCRFVNACVSSTFAVTGASGYALIVGFGSCSQLAQCNTYMMADDTAMVMSYMFCTFVSTCGADLDGSLTHSRQGFNQCSNIVNCSVNGNSGFSTYGFVSCTQVQQCSAVDVVGKYSSSYSDAGSNACANTAAGGYNS